MDNLKKFTDKVQKFYALVETHVCEIQNLVKESAKPLHSITNQSALFRAVVKSDAVAETPLAHIEGFKESLIDDIFTLLQEEYSLLEDIKCKINAANEKLQKEQSLIENQYQDLNSKGLFDRSLINPCCPAFEHILGWSYDIWRYYHLFYLQISQALFSLNFEEESTVKALTKAFKEDLELKKQIDIIRSYNLSKFEFLT